MTPFSSEMHAAAGEDAASSSPTRRTSSTYASRYFNHDSIFFIGRNLDYAMGLEGSLKLKEISYIHSEAYASGELKHGTISLIEPGTLVVALGTYAPLFDKAMSNVVEVKARGAEVLALTTERLPGKDGEDCRRHCLCAG